MRTWLRYVVPLTVVSVVAMLPFVYFALIVRAPGDVATARAQMKLGWELVAIAWIFQLWLVGAAAPLVRQPALSQWDAVKAAFIGLGNMAVPVGVAVIAILAGCVALVIPGLVLLVMLSLTGASLPAQLPKPLVESIAVAHKHWKQLAVLVAAIVIADLAITAIAHVVLVPKIPAKASGAMLAPTRLFVRIVAGVLVIGSALPACLLAQFKHARDA
ncbi:MAG: hypothetical protein QM831_05005 [Kofleriaceae bacterium]